MTKFSVFTGVEETKHSLGMKRVFLPIWGFKKNGIAKFEKDVTERPLYFLGYKLPISYKTVTFREKESVTREYTQKAAVAKGKEIALNDLKKKLPYNSEVIGENILHQRLEHGKVVLTIHYQVLENIAIERPIVQGD